MNRPVKAWAVAGVLAAALVFGAARDVAGQATGAIGQLAAAEIAYRKAVMDGVLAHTMALRALILNNVHNDDARKHSAALRALASMFDGIFPSESKEGVSNARKEIWTNSQDFATRLHTFQEAANTLDEEVAKNLGSAQTAPRLQMLITTCDGCHAAFKLPAALPF